MNLYNALLPLLEARSSAPSSGFSKGSLILIGSLVLSLSLGGCGFQLRGLGTAQIPAEWTPVLVQSDGEIGALIEQRLDDTGVETPMTTDPAAARLRIRVISQSRRSEVAALGSDGKAIAYDLIYQVRFEAVDATGGQLMRAQDIRVERTFDDNPADAVLGKAEEAEIIYAEMMQEAAQQLLFRLRAYLSATRNTSSGETRGNAGSGSATSNAQ